MADSILCGAGDAQCSSELDLAVQVTGTGHVAKPIQKLAIKIAGKDKANYATTNKEIFKDTGIASTIFKWPENTAKAQGQKQLVLEIPTTQKGKINLPLCENLQTCGSEPAAWYLANRLYSIVPLYNFGIYTNQQTNYKEQHYAGARIGYIYIFLGNTLWRELFISREKSGNNIFEDIDLSKFRNQDNHYKDQKRQPIGQALQDIWVPGSFQGNQQLQIRIAFSDVQWSGSRINYLQTNATDLQARTTLFAPQSEQILVAQLESTKDKEKFAISNNQTSLVPLNLLPPTRARNETIEFSIDHPAKYLITNNHIQTHQTKTAQQIDKYLADRDSQMQYSLKSNSNSNFDASAYQYNLLAKKQAYAEPKEGIQPPSSQRTIDEENIYNSLKDVWTDQTAFTDSLQIVKQRAILGVLVEDKTYPITHAKERIKLLTSIFSTVILKVQKNPLYPIASIIEKQRKIVKEFEEGISEQMSAEGRKKYDKALAGPIRRELHRRINYYQTQLAYYLGTDKNTPYTLADLFSNYDSKVDLVGHLNYMAETLNLMSLSMASYDPLLPIEAETDTSVYDDTVPSAVVLDITTNIKNPLHKLLYPQVELDDLTQPFVPKAAEQNNGDGVFNAGLWNSISNNDSLLKQEPTTLNGAAVNKISQQANVLLSASQYPNFKVMNAALYGIIGAMADARKHAQENILAQQQEFKEAKQTLSRLEQELTVYQKDQQKVAINKKIKLQQKQKYLAKIAAAEEALKSIEDAFQNKLQALGAVKARIPLKELEMLRIAGGESFHKLQIKLETAVTLKGTNTKKYYVLGSIDHVVKPKANLKRKFSLFDGDMLFTPKTKGPRGDVYLIVLPDNDPYVLQRKKQLQEQIPELEKQLAKNRHALTHIEGELLDLADKQTITTQLSTQAAGKVINQQGQYLQKGSLVKQAEKAISSRINTMAQRIEKTGVVPPVLLGLELINLKLVFENTDNTLRTRGIGRTLAGYVTAVGDSAMATIAVLETLQAHHQLFAQKTLVAKGIKFLAKDNSVLISMGLTKAVNRTIPLGLLAVFNTGLSAWDAYTAFQQGDGAMYGNFVLALSGGASVMSILAGAGASVGFGPGGWLVASILLLAAGVVLLWKLSDTELEQWFKQGPFGAYSSYPDLKQPEQALAVLLNMVFQPTVEMEANPFQTLAKERLTSRFILAKDSLAPEQWAILEKVSQANTCIILTSELMGFANTSTVIRYGCRLYQYKEDIGGYKVTTYERNYTPINYPILHKEVTPEGVILFTYTPKANHYSQGYLWLAAIQVMCEFYKDLKNNFVVKRPLHHFPAPAFTEKMQYNPAVDNNLLLTMPKDDSGYVTVSGGGELTQWAQKLKQNYWKKLIIDGDNIL